MEARCGDVLEEGRDEAQFLLKVVKSICRAVDAGPVPG